MTDIKMGLTIKDQIGLGGPGQFGVALAGEKGDSISVHIEAYGFTTDRQGALDLTSFLRDMVRALEMELGIHESGQSAEFRLDPTLAGHNPLDAACVHHTGETGASAARCPVCRPIRPAFNPQPRKA